MARFYQKSSYNPSKIQLPKSAREAGPLKKERKSLAMCKKCNAFYYKKSWHHSTDTLSPREARKLNVEFRLCPACKMISERLYEGKLTIENVPNKFRVELLNLIKSFGKRAEQIDSQHRLIEIGHERGNIVVTTTENQLAAKLAKKIKGVFNKVDVRFSHSKEPYEVERVRVKFL